MINSASNEVSTINKWPCTNKLFLIVSETKHSLLRTIYTKPLVLNLEYKTLKKLTQLTF